jgi:hypothetical protein
MASIEIQADKVITSCEKYLSVIRKHAFYGNDVKAKKKYNIEVENTSTVEKIKNLVEYANENSEQEGFSSYLSPTITITHNDYELIGEFL